MNEVAKEGAAQLVELSNLQAQTPSGPAVLGGNVGLLQGVKVKLNVMVGEAQTTVGELMSLKEFSVLKVDRLADAPIDVFLEGNLVARGQLVVVDDNFGVRITEIASTGQS
ncbi:MAG: FliM/FliN family flagellar motor switch protein [Burkholderiales bacterium]|nr:FliM/FliN family flagellar motor switch protein [Burkholderiales bacterium]